MTEMALVFFCCICSLSEVEWNILAGGQLRSWIHGGAMRERMKRSGIHGKAVL